jgi:hypothetical protein
MNGAGIGRDDVPLGWALRYASLGWSVVPVHSLRDGSCSCGRTDCPSPGKHPRIRWETAMHEPACAADIAGWWDRWPDANLGVVTGTVSGIAVLDVDPRHGGEAALARLEERRGPLPITPEVRTGGGGRHLWFDLGSALASTVVGSGLDLKADGGMVVAPPSVHASGGRYRWRPGGAPDVLDLAPLPGWLEIPEGLRPGGPGGGGPPRTTGEQETFARTWARAGIVLEPGDRYYRCPFHDDHEPSLHVDAEGCRWYCFGCGIGGGIGRLREMLGESEPAVVRRRLTEIETGRGPPITLHGSSPVEVVGESHHQDELLQITGGRRHYGGVDAEAVASLVPDPANPHDPQAVEVRIAERTVGYVGRDDLYRVRVMVDDSLDLHGFATCRALIRGGWDRGHGRVGSFGVVLLLPDDG